MVSTHVCASPCCCFLANVLEIVGLQDACASSLLKPKPHDNTNYFKVPLDHHATTFSVMWVMMRRCSRTRLAKQLSDACADPDPAALDAVLKAYGRDIISAVGAEVDRIESDIQRLQPGIR